MARCTRTSPDTRADRALLRLFFAAFTDRAQADRSARRLHPGASVEDKQKALADEATARGVVGAIAEGAVDLEKI